MSAPGRTEDGWLVGDVASFRFFADHLPPRPFSYRSMLRSEVRLGKTWLWWAATASGIGLGILGDWWGYLLGGALALGYWAMLRAAVHGVRDVPFAVATVTGLAGAPGRGGVVLADARIDEARSVRVAVDRRLAEAVLATEGRFEVAILYKAGAGYSTVIGVRASADDRETR